VGPRPGLNAVANTYISLLLLGIESITLTLWRTFMVQKTLLIGENNRYNFGSFTHLDVFCQSRQRKEVSCDVTCSVSGS
jgi:hypothetical protein